MNKIILLNLKIKIHVRNHRRSTLATIFSEEDRTRHNSVISTII